METQGQPDLFLDHLDFSSILIRWSEKTMINCSMRVFKYEIEMMNGRENTYSEASELLVMLKSDS